MCFEFIDEKIKPEKWPANAREYQLESIYIAFKAYLKNPGYRTREVVLALVNYHDYNQFSAIGEMRVTEYEVALINTLYVWGSVCNFNCLKTFLYEQIGETTALHKTSNWIFNLQGIPHDIAIKSYDEGLDWSLKLYHYAYQKYNTEKNSKFSTQIINIVEDIISSSHTDYSCIAHAFIRMLNDLSYMKGNKRTSFWEFDRDELRQLFQLESRLIKLTNQNPSRRPLKGVLMTQISNYILKSRNNYNDDYICKYISSEDAKKSLVNHQLWMRKTTKLNDVREEKIIPELFSENSWIKYDWAQNIDIRETRTYYVSSFCKEMNNADMVKKYGECIYGFKNDRIAELIAPIYLIDDSRLFGIDKDDLAKNEIYPCLSQVIEFDILYDKESTKEELSFLFDIVNELINDDGKKAFLQEIIQYWLLSVKDSEWSYERERRYVIFLYDEYEYLELEKDDTFLKPMTSLLSLPDFLLGERNPSHNQISALIENKLQFISNKPYMFCHNCLNADYDVVNGIGKITNCPICNSKRIEIRK